MSLSRAVVYWNSNVRSSYAFYVEVLIEWYIYLFMSCVGLGLASPAMKPLLSRGKALNSYLCH